VENDLATYHYVGGLWFAHLHPAMMPPSSQYQRPFLFCAETLKELLDHVCIYIGLCHDAHARAGDLLSWLIQLGVVV